jgi:putative Holliday junction resolvase
MWLTNDGSNRVRKRSPGIRARRAAGERRPAARPSGEPFFEDGEPRDAEGRFEGPGLYSPRMRYLGLDVGDKRIGVSLSDETATIAGGLETVRRVGRRQDLRAVAETARVHEVGEIVFGLPRRLDGSLGPQAEKVLAFAAELRQVVEVPVVPWDERFTTRIAEQTLIEGGVSRKGRRASVDKVAATLILQNYLDYRKLAADGPA